MFLRFVLFLSLCKLCTSQTTKKVCRADLLAESVSNHSGMIVRDATATSAKLMKLKTEVDRIGLTYLSGDINNVIGDLKEVVDIQSSFRDQVFIIRNVVSLIEDEPLIPFCDQLNHHVETWSIRNYFEEKILHLAAKTHTELYDCVFTESNDNCKHDYGLPFLFTRNYQHTADVSEFWNKFVELRNEYNQSHSSFSRMSLFIMWMRSIKYTDKKFFDRLVQGYEWVYELLKSTFPDRLDALLNVGDDIDTIKNRIDDFDDGYDIQIVLDYAPTINMRLEQLKFLNNYVTSYESFPYLVDAFEMLKRDSTKRGIPIEDPKSLAPSVAQSLRALVSDHNVRVEAFFESETSWLLNVKKTLEVMEKNQKQRSLAFEFAKSKLQSIVTYTEYVVSYLRCFDDPIDISRAISVIYLRAENDEVDVDTVNNVIQKNEDFIIKIEAFVKLQKRFWKNVGTYLSSLNDHEVINDVIDSNMLQKLSDQAQLVEELENIFEDRCKSSQSLTLTKLITQLNLESNLIFDFTSDDLESTSTDINYIDRVFIDPLESKLRGLDDAYDHVVDLFEDSYYLDVSILHPNDIQGMLDDKLKIDVKVAESLSDIHSSLDTLSDEIFDLEPEAMVELLLMYPLMEAVVYSQRGRFMSFYARDIDYPDVLMYPAFTLFDISFSELILEFNTTDYIRGYTSNADRLSLYTSDHEGHNYTFIEWPVCVDGCFYTIEFTQLQQARIAFGFLNSQKYVNDGICVETATLTEDIFHVAMLMNVPGAIIYLSYENLVGEDIEYPFILLEKERLKYFKPFIAFTGSLEFEWKKSNAAAIEVPVSAYSHPLYKMYEQNLIENGEKYTYLMKGRGPETGVKKWFHLVREWDSICQFAGAARVTKNKYFGYLEFGFYYDGRFVYRSPNGVCIHHGNLDQVGTATPTVDHNAELFMASTLTWDAFVDEYHLELEFYSSTSSIGYELSEFVESRFVPSFGFQIDSSLVELLSIEMMELQEAPPAIADKVKKQTCMKDSQCTKERTGADDMTCLHSRNCRSFGGICQTERDCPLRDVCIDTNDWRFGICGKL